MRARQQAAAADAALEGLAQARLVEVGPPFAQRGQDVLADLDAVHREAHVGHRGREREFDVPEAHDAHRMVLKGARNLHDKA